MILSKQDEFSAAQAITASAASTNVIDLRAAGIPYGSSTALARDQGVNAKGAEIPLLIQVVTAFATLTSLKVAVQMSVDEAFTSPLTVLETEAIAAASLVAGYTFNIDKLPLKTTARYIRLYYTVAGSNATAGAVTAAIVPGLQQNPL